MQLTAKNVKTLGPAYEATIYVNGERAFRIHNDGNGGEETIAPTSKKGAALLEELAAWLDGQTVEHFGMELPRTVAIAAEEAVEAALQTKQVTDILSKCVMLVTADGRLQQMNRKPTPELLADLNRQLADRGRHGDRILNLMEVDEAAGYLFA